MKRVILILKREYKARFFSKPFLLLCLVLPVMLAAMFMSTVVNTKPQSKPRTRNLAIYHVIDEADVLKEVPPRIGNIAFEIDSGNLAGSMIQLEDNKIKGILHITDSMGLQCRVYTNGIVEESDFRAIALNVEDIVHAVPAMRRVANQAGTAGAAIHFKRINIEADEHQPEGMRWRTVLSIALSCTIYFFIFFYGVRTLNAVVEEKMNRVSEIIISSVSPFELMLGKILGITAAVFTQVIIVACMTFVLANAGVALVGPGDPVAAAPGAMDSGKALSTSVYGGITTFEAVKVGISFTVFFIVGFMLYAAIFAAIGAAMDPHADTLQFVFPVMIPLFFSLILVVTSALSDPANPVVMWASFIPFTSPVVMTMRLLHGAPAWQILVSMTLLIACFVAVTFLGGRIFRVGILLYGTKPDLRTIGRWLFSTE